MRKVIYSFSILLLISCGGKNVKEFEDKKVSNEFESKKSSNEFEIIYHNNSNGVPEKSYRLIRNIEDFRAFSLSINLKEIPKVDFEKSNVLILNMGQKNTGGYDVSLEKMIPENDKLVAIIKETSPKKGDMVTMAITSPICIVKINSKKEVVIK